MKLRLRSLMLGVITLLVIAFVPLSDSAMINTSVDNNDIQYNIQKLMSIHGMEGNSSIEFLLDESGAPSFVLGVNATGYMITSINTYRILEYGEVNPYKDHNIGNKYYGGFCLYYIKNDIGIFDLERNKYVDKIASLNNLSSLMQTEAVSGNLIEPLSGIGDPTLTKDVTLPFASSYILRKAFGCNDNDTCTAVACGIALNYLDSRYNGNVVASYWQHETLGNIPTSGDLTATIFKAQYPKAQSLRDYLVFPCLLAPASCGILVTNGINNYRNNAGGLVYGTGISAQYYGPWPLSSIAKHQLDLNRPSMMTTLNNSTDWDYHTMLIYGYETYSDGSAYYKVHTGWYQDLIRDPNNNGNWYMPLKICPVEVAWYLYSFYIVNFA